MELLQNVHAHRLPNPSHSHWFTFMYGSFNRIYLPYEGVFKQFKIIFFSIVSVLCIHIGLYGKDLNLKCVTMWFWNWFHQLELSVLLNKYLKYTLKLSGRRDSGSFSRSPMLRHQCFYMWKMLASTSRKRLASWAVLQLGFVLHPVTPAVEIRASAFWEHYEQCDMSTNRLEVDILQVLHFKDYKMCLKAVLILTQIHIFVHCVYIKLIMQLLSLHAQTE